MIVGNKTSHYGYMNMGLDLYAACKTINGVKTEPTTTVSSMFPEIPEDYYHPSFFKLRHLDPRRLVTSLMEEGREDLASRFYGNLAGARHYFPESSIEEMPLGLNDAMLPPIISAQEALSLANDLKSFSHKEVSKTIDYLRFWGSRDHPVMCSY